MTETTFKFTEAKLKALPLPADGQRSTYRDTDVKGLELRVTATGVKTFSWYRRPKNQAPQRVTIGRSPDVTVIQARTEAQRHNASIAAGESPAEARRAQRQEMPFSELFALYINDHAKLRKGTWKEDEQRYNQYLAGPLGRMRVSAVTRENVRALHAQITADGHPAVANRVLALVSSIFGRAVEWSILTANPARGIRRNVETSRDRFLGSEEVPRFLNSLMAEPSETVRDLFLMLLFTGARLANVLAMAWTEVNLEGGFWRIPMTKSGDAHNVPLIPEAMDVLTRRRAAALGGKFVFPGAGLTGHLADPKKAWQRLFDRDELAQIRALIEAKGGKVDAVNGEPVERQLDRAKTQAAAMAIDCSGCRMPPTRIHDLRRTMGSWQAMTGASLNVIGKGLGHKNIATTAIYSRLQLNPVRDAMAKAGSAMLTGIDLSQLGKAK